MGILGAWAYARSGASRTDVVRDLAVGWSFTAAGLLAWWRRPADRTGFLMTAEGLTWFIGNLQGTSVPLLFAAGAWAEGLNLAVLAHLLLAFPDGRLATPPARRVVASTYDLVAVGGLLRASTYGPAVSSGSTYLSCEGCGPNALLIHRDPELFEAIDLGYRWIGALLVLVVFGALVRRWRVSCPARRRVLIPAWTAVTVAVVLVGWEAVYAVAPGLLGSGEVFLLLSDLGQVAVPVTFTAGLLRMRLRRAAVGSLVIEVGASPTPRRLEEAVAQVVGDPSLQLGLGMGEPGAYADPDGLRLRLPPAGSGRTTTPVESHGAPVAVLVHDTALREDLGPLTAVTASVRLCLENTAARRGQPAHRGGPRVALPAHRGRRP